MDMAIGGVQLEAIQSALSLQELAADALTRLATPQVASLAKALTDLMVVEHVVEAQIAVMQAADETTGQLLDLLA